MSQGAHELLPGYHLSGMTGTDVDEVAAIEAESFHSAWPAGAFRHEIERNPYARSFVVRTVDGALAAYACVWFLEDQLLVNNLAVEPHHRRRGLGRRLMDFLMLAAAEAGCREVLLEVRPSNLAARALYRGLGFRQLAIRQRYYTDGEDALVLRRDLPRRGDPAGA